MTFPLSRIMSTATAAYGGFCFVNPRHLGKAVTSNPIKQADLDVLAHVFGARDLAISSLAIFGRSSTTVTSAMLLRIVLDVCDGLILANEADSDEARNKALGITFSWATLNVLALTIDRRRARKGFPITV